VKYLITFGNSRVGRAALKVLRDLGETDIVVGARDPAKSEQELKAAGASVVVELDLDKKETVEKALEGVEKVLLVHTGRVPFPVITQWAQTVAEAAIRPGSTVKTIGKIAAIFADSKSPVPVVKTHGEVLDILVNTGLQVFSIGPSFFFENWLDELKGQTVWYGAAGDVELFHIAVADIAEAAISVLRNPAKYNGKHLGIAGDIVGEQTLAKLIADATGLPITYKLVSFEEYEEIQKKKRNTEIEAVAWVSREKIKVSGAFGSKVRNTDLLVEILGHQPINAKVWARANKDKFT